MSLAKQAGMVKKLSDLTDSGVIEWKPSVNEGTFQVSFRDNTLRITTRGAQEQPDVVINLINHNGEIVESFNDIDLNDSDQPTGSTKSWYGIMRELFENARRKALGADRVLDEIIADLDATDDIPF
jgi:hypothetical protein